MLKKIFFCLLLSCCGLQAQQIETPYKTKKIIASRDTIRIDSVSVNSSFFKLLNANAEPIDSTFYHIDFQKVINGTKFIILDELSYYDI